MTILLGLSPIAQAATLTVGPGQGYTAISVAVGDSNPDDIIEVMPDFVASYTDQWTVTHNLTIRATGSQSFTRLVPASTVPLMTVDGTSAITPLNVTIEGFQWNLSDSAQGIAVTGNNTVKTTLTVNNNLFLDGTGINGGAIQAINADLVLNMNTFTGNEADVNGGAVAHFGDDGSSGPYGSLVAFGNLFEGGYARGGVEGTGGGGLYVFNLELLDLDFNTFDKNEADNGVFPRGGYGGGLFVENTVIEFNNNEFCANDAQDWGGGVYFKEVPGGYLENNVFAENDADIGGGMAWSSLVETYKPAITNNSFIGNDVNDAGGGAGAFFEGVLFDWNNNLVAFNDLFLSVGTGLSAVDFGVGQQVDIEHSLWFTNGGGHLGSDLATHQFSGTNVIDEDPLLIFGVFTDGDCFTDSHFTSPFSPAVNAGDPAIFDVGSSRSDIGAFGGPGADVVDNDGDDWENVYDCNTNDDTIFPGANEVCDGQDNNCDGFVDENFTTTWYRDFDSDGYGDELDSQDACSAPSGYVAGPLDGGNAFDCDDSTNSVAGEQPYFHDQDEDGFGDPMDTVMACPGSQPSGYIVDDNDCNDDDDQETIEIALPPDDDNDTYGDLQADVADWLVGCPSNPPLGYADPRLDEDCDDDNFDIRPDADEVCNNIDDDCDGMIDNNVVTGGEVVFPDADNDGYYDETAGHSSSIGCSSTNGFAAAANDGDCDDADDTISPGVTSVVVGDGIDQNCSGHDECFVDNDLDGFGWVGEEDQIDALANIVDDADDNNCASAGVSLDETDCRDSGAKSSDANPDAVPTDSDVADNIDIDCDGVDECYQDADEDGFGGTIVPDAGNVGCVDAGELNTGGDCDDVDKSTNPNAPEFCDGFDNDCDGEVDEVAQISAGELTTWYADADGDGFGNPQVIVQSCENRDLDGHVQNATDCNDDLASANPDAEEVCDGEDNDCDNEADESAVDAVEYWVDSDNDGFGAKGEPTRACEQPDGFVTKTGDCDDADEDIGDCQTDCSCSSQTLNHGHFGLLAVVALFGMRRRRQS